VNNTSRRIAKRAPDPRFTRLVELMTELRQGGGIDIRVERGKDSGDVSVLAFAPSRDPQVEARRAEVREILGLRPDLREFRVYYGGYSGKGDEISMSTRSMLQIMLELAVGVEVPEADVSAGRAAPGVVVGQQPPAPGPSPVTILSGSEEPDDAHVAVEYNDRWFWIPDTDIRSKYSFGFVMLLYSISGTGVRSGAPVVTVPANQ
jgi:hypothetical protein